MRNTLFNRAFGGIKKEFKLWFRDDDGKDRLVSDDPILIKEMNKEFKAKVSFIYDDKILDEGTMIG